MACAVGCCEKLVGVSQYSNYPPSVSDLPKIGSYVKLDLEKIVSLKPDLVLATARGNPKAAVDRLRQLGLSVFVIFPKGIEGAAGSIANIGNVCGKPQEGASLKAKFEQESKRHKKAKSDSSPRVLMLLNPEPPIACSPDTLGGRLIEWVGGNNIIEDSKIRYPTISLEWILEQDPDYIFLMQMGAQQGRDVADYWKKFPDLKAVKNGRVFRLDPDLVSRSGMRLLEVMERMSGFMSTSGEAAK